MLLYKKLLLMTFGTTLVFAGFVQYLLCTTQQLSLRNSKR